MAERQRLTQSPRPRYDGGMINAGSDEGGFSSTVDETPAEEHEAFPPDLARKVFLLKCLYFLGGVSASTWGRFGTVYYIQKVSCAFYVIVVLKLCIIISDCCHNYLLC
jgi:hypothetical protein